jgi:hypothetical protein
MRGTYGSIAVVLFLGMQFVQSRAIADGCGKPFWERTGVLPAAEANQAAAALGEHVYAITNRVVAKYDRRTGQRVAESRGAAEHLNSGFFWEGKLYCAHSNYPKKPDRSDVKVLDPQSMQLTTFKNFGESDGSLTWVIRHEDQWWCTFAFYREENARTYLARFDDRWRERGRWRYPPEIVRRMGRASISGGIWWQGSLLVSGHDERELYRLQLPAKGDVLEYLETIPAPFTGQGFAVDPATGGLLGIDRARRQIVFAELSDGPQ